MPNKLVNLSDSSVIAKLNDRWQTVGKVRGKFGTRTYAVAVAAALRRLAAEGHIERKAEGTGVQKRRGRGQFGELTVDLYRQLPNYRNLKSE